MLSVSYFRLIGFVAVIGILVTACFPKSDNRPHCQEDEALIVKVDTNPKHGLTWICVNLETHNFNP